MPTNCPQAVDSRALFEELGLALYTFQSIEVRIKFLLPHLNVPLTDAPPPDEGWAGRQKYLESKEMLGKLVRLFQERLTTEDPVEMERAFREVVQGRNDVVHAFVAQPFAGGNTDEELRQSIDYVRVRRLRAVPLLQILDAMSRGFTASLTLPPDFQGEVPVDLPDWLGVRSA
jgi:hypothetical protein